MSITSRYLSIARLSVHGLQNCSRAANAPRESVLFRKFEEYPFKLVSVGQTRGYSPIDTGSSSPGVWDRMKGMVGMGPKDMDLTKPFTIDEYAKQISRAKSMGNMASYLPQNMRNSLPAGASEQAAKIYDSQVKIIEAMTSEERANPNTRIDAAARTRIAQQTGCAPEAVTDCVSKYEYMRATVEKMSQMKKEGKKLPQNFQEMNNLMGGYKPPTSHKQAPPAGARGGPRRQMQDPVGRTTAGMSIITQSSGTPGKNAPCPCRSGKRYKRCCWEKDQANKDQTNTA